MTNSLITLGVEPNRLVVVDGSSVPLIDSRSHRGTLRLVAGLVVLFFDWSCSCSSINPATGYPHFAIRPSGVDLVALRNELFPKPNTLGGWTSKPPAEASSDSPHLTARRYPVDRMYWTHRPGNDPAKQAAFDSALSAWVARYPAYESGVPEVQALIYAARALGYGS